MATFKSLYLTYRDGLKIVPRLREFFRHVEAKVISNNRHKINQTWEPLLAHPSTKTDLLSKIFSIKLEFLAQQVFFLPKELIPMPLSLEIDSNQFFQGRAKIGFAA